MGNKKIIKSSSGVLGLLVVLGLCFYQLSCLTVIFFYCCPVKIMKRFKYNISPDSRYVWYTYEPF